MGRHPTVTVMLYKGRKLVKRYLSPPTVRSVLEKALTRSGITRYVIHALYGKQKDALGKRQEFVNDYEGGDVREAKRALTAFME